MVARIISNLQSINQSRIKLFKLYLLVLNKWFNFMVNFNEIWIAVQNDVSDLSRNYRITVSGLKVIEKFLFSVTLIGYVISLPFLKIDKTTIFQRFAFLSSHWSCVMVEEGLNQFVRWMRPNKRKMFLDFFRLLPMLFLKHHHLFIWKQV